MGAGASTGKKKLSTKVHEQQRIINELTNQNKNFEEQLRSHKAVTIPGTPRTPDLSQTRSHRNQTSINFSRKQKDTPFAAHVQNALSLLQIDFTNELHHLLNDICNAAKALSSYLHQLGATRGSQTSSLPFYKQAELIFYHALSTSGHVCGILSDKSPKLLELVDGVPLGNYLVCVSPIVGTEHDIESAFGVHGSLFSIYKRISEIGSSASSVDLIRTPNEQIAAGYFLYGVSTTMVYTVGQGVYSCHLDPTTRIFRISHPSSIKVPDSGQILIGDGSEQAVAMLSPVHASFTQTIHTCHNWLLGIHQILMHGGAVVMPEAEVHFLTQAAPLSFIAEQSGAFAMTKCGNLQKIWDSSLIRDSVSTSQGSSSSSLHVKSSLYWGSTQVLGALLSSSC